jgi:hypothetical protein
MVSGCLLLFQPEPSMFFSCFIVIEFWHYEVSLLSMTWLMSICIGQVDSMDWNDENISLGCKLFAQQVSRGNRPNNHLNGIGYDEVIQIFKQAKGIELTKLQLKNKWDKLKPDYTAWNKLMRRQTGIGFDHAKGVVVMDDEWRKAKKVRVKKFQQHL